MSILSGDCNRCGMCCTVEVSGHRFVCQYLRAELGPTYQPKPLGTPGATRCGAYANRYDGMPIQLKRLAQDGSTEVIHTVCAKGSWPETKAIIERGIGQGCSLTLDKAAVPAITELAWDAESVDEVTWLRAHGYSTPEPKLIVTTNDTAFIRTGKA